MHTAQAANKHIISMMLSLKSSLQKKLEVTFIIDFDDNPVI